MSGTAGFARLYFAERPELLVLSVRQIMNTQKWSICLFSKL
jgi:hypothetical protein